MGNLVRGPQRLLFNTINQLHVGAYTDGDSNKVIAFKKDGIYITNSTAANVSAFSSFGRNENLETVLLDLVAPYPCEVCNYIVELNMVAVARKSNGGIRDHRELMRNYAGKIDSLETSSTTEIADVDKLSVLKQLVQYINRDEYRFANAGMTYVVYDGDSDDASSITITLENGLTKTLTSVAGTSSLAAKINADTDLNPYVKAYMPSVTNVSETNLTLVIESLTPCYFDVTAGTDTTVEAFYLKLEQLKENVKLIFEGGSSMTQWSKVEYFKYTMDAAACVDAADDADFTITIEETATAVNITTNTDDDTKALGAAVALSTLATVAIPASAYLTGYDVDGVVTVICIGATIDELDNTAVSDLWDIEEIDFTFKWGLLRADDMDQLFPNGYGSEFQHTVQPDPDARYFQITIKYLSEADDNVTMDGVLAGKRGQLDLFIKEDQMPATVTAATKNYWLNASSMMQDAVPTSADYNVAELLNFVFPSLITDAILAE